MIMRAIIIDCAERQGYYVALTSLDGNRALCDLGRDNGLGGEHFRKFMRKNLRAVRNLGP